ncbi:MAG: M16 family metallopeptidase [Bacteroidota bacterium]
MKYASYKFALFLGILSLVNGFARAQNKVKDATIIELPGTAPGISKNQNPYKAPASKILPYTIHQKQLSNGLNVVTVPTPHPGLAAFYIVVRVGSREEVEPGKTGFAHFFEHMMFRGTEKYPKEKYSDELKATGASANANTWFDRTVYHMTGNAAMLDKMFELESDRFMNLKYSVQDFKTEAGAVKGEYTKNSASPYNQLNEQLNDVAFTKHTYKHTTMGFFKDIVDMPNQFDYSISFFNRFYRPEYTTIIVVGDVTPERVNKLSESYFGMWKRGSYVASIPAEPAQTATRFTHLKMEGFPPYLSLNFKGPAFRDNDREGPAFDLLLTMMTSEKSGLYKKLVKEDQQARSLSGTSYYTRDPYLGQIEVSLVNSAAMKGVKAALDSVVRRVKSVPFTAAELTEAKSRMRYIFTMDADSPTRIAESLSYFTWVTGDPESVNRTYAMYDSLTADDLLRVANKYLVDSGLTIATISSDEKSPVQ